MFQNGFSLFVLAANIVKHTHIIENLNRIRMRGSQCLCANSEGATQQRLNLLIFPFVLVEPRQSMKSRRRFEVLESQCLFAQGRARVSAKPQPDRRVRAQTNTSLPGATGVPLRER